MLHLDADYPALLIIDVFKGQMTPAVMNLFKANNIFLTQVTKSQSHQLVSTTGPHSEHLCQVVHEENVYGMVCFKNLRGSWKW